MDLFNVYVDESGKLRGNSEYTALCGYVAHTQEWNRVGLEWNACRLRWEVPPIHMSRIANPERKQDDWKTIQEKWGGLWESRRDRMLEEFSAIIARASVVCVGAVVDTTAYRKIERDKSSTLHWPDSNVFAFHYVVMRSIEAIERVDRFSPISVVVDDDPENACEYYRLLNMLRTHSSPQFEKVRDRVHAISFCNDASYPGLQAADMLAYVSRRTKVESADKVLMEAVDFDSFPASLYPNLTNGGVHQPRVYTEELLYEVVRGVARLNATLE